MTRRVAAAILVIVALTATACSGDVVIGRAVGSGSASASGGTSSSVDARFSDDRGDRDLISDVRDGVVAATSYDYRDLPGSKAEALRHLTAPLSAQYTTTFDTLVAKTATARQVWVSATVKDVGLATRVGKTAMLLVFGSLDTSAKDISGLRTTAITVAVTAKQTNGDWLLSDLRSDGAIDGSSAAGAPGNAALTTATTTARSVAAATTGMTRAGFDARYDALLATTAGDLRATLLKNRAATKQALIAQGADFVAQVRAVAVSLVLGSLVEVLVSVVAYKVTNGVRAATGATSRQKLVVRRLDGRWRVSEQELVG